MKPQFKQKQSFSKNTNTFVFLYGRHPVTAALHNPNRKIKELYLTKEAAGEIKVPADITVHVCPKEQLDSLVGKEAVHQGFVAKCAPLKNKTIEEVIEQTRSQKETLVVILDQVSDPHNIGAILRSAGAFQAAAVIVPEAGAPDETGVLAKSSSGVLELVPYVRVANLARAMEALKKNGFWCIGFDGNAPHSVYETKLPSKCALVLGSEGFGLRRLTAQNCDDTVKLPMNPQVESLNVSNACAIALYEWNRQHHA